MFGFTGGTREDPPEQQLLGRSTSTSRRGRINAGTAISSKAATRIGAANVRDAVLYARGALVPPQSQPRTSDATTVLDEINQNKSEVY